MRDHPVPQDITGYKFHIVGSMTIKQFAMVAGGVVLAFLVNMTNLPVIIKWPIMVILAGAGAMAAFVPIEEQPLDHWITTFFRVLYKPTQYYWKRQAKVPEAFSFEQRSDVKTSDAPADLSPARKERIKEYLFSLNAQQPDEYELYEQNRIDKIEQVFFDKQQEAKEVDKKTLSLPRQKVVDVSNRNKPAQTPQNQVPPNQQTQPQQLAFNQTQEKTTPISNDTIATTHNIQLPFPNKATEPNKIVGMVLSSNNELINDAIVEIKKESGQVLRAVKSNSLGQFFISTPLKNDSYIVSAEKNGFSFPQSRLILRGEIVEPIEIKSL
ncbi:MAG: PrgI family protein [Patescibacteria group bacterium]